MRHVLTALIVMGLGGFFAACQKLDNKKKMGSQPDCFTQLHPGAVKSGKLTGIHFQNGSCIGPYKALNVASFKNTVVVSLGGQMVESELFVVGSDVLVDAAGQKIKIGQLIRNRDEYRLEIANHIEYHLMVSVAGASQPWKMGMEPNWSDEKIMLSVNM